MIQLKSKYIALSFLLSGICISAQNPVIQTQFTPDPAPMIYKNRLYVFTGDDQPGFDFYTMTKWRIHSSEDMVNWTDHGSPISLESFSWARDRAWAAQWFAGPGTCLFSARTSRRKARRPQKRAPGRCLR